MNIAVLFDGAGLARLGLERAGHRCTGFELDPDKHALSLHVGSGRCELADVREVDLSRFDGVWASPPCQWRSDARTQGAPVSEYSTDLLQWSLDLPHDVLWVENVVSSLPGHNVWGTMWNAAQFLAAPIQNRNRVIGGRYDAPPVYGPYRKAFPGICPCITASEDRGCATDTRRASRWYGRRLTLEECAYHQGFKIPEPWYEVPDGWKRGKWHRNLYQAIGNGVPVYMAQRFGLMYPT